jgi:predicted nucleic acid-binding protein
VRILLDTDVVVAAMRSPRGASAELLRRIDKGGVTLLLSVALALEYESNCMLAKHRLAAGLSEEETGAFVDWLIAMAEPVQTHYRWRPQLHDPGNELVLEAAVSGRASELVTFNEKGLGKAEQGFGIAVVRPGEALRRIQP